GGGTVQRMDEEWVPDYHEGWNRSTGVWVSLVWNSFSGKYLKGFWQDFETAILFFLSEVIAYDLDQYLYLSLLPLNQYVTLPVGLVFLINKFIEPRARSLVHGFISLIEFIRTEKRVSGNLEPVDAGRERIRILSRRVPVRNKRKKSGG